MESQIEKIFEDDEILVLDKPAGMVVNRSLTTKSGTLQDVLDNEYTFEGESEKVDGFSQRSGIVHRLDKDTSGLLVIAKTNDAFVSLLAQFKERKAVKEYLAVLCGKVVDNLFEIDAPIKRNPNNPMKFAVSPEGKEAFTKFEKIKDVKHGENSYSLLKIFPKTGRTHQIRVHSAALGHPVAGDPIYCTKVLLETSFDDFGRMMLHSHTLGLFHPKTDKFMQFSSQVPKEFPF